MKNQKSRRLGRDDWVCAGLSTLYKSGVEGVKIVVIAREMGVTSGSFYWHFKNLKDFLDEMLNYWETHLTDDIALDARSVGGSPQDRILSLMLQVINEDAAVPDHAICLWGRSDSKVNEVYERTLLKRFEFAAWMFREAGFTADEARVRGRMMVSFLIGESSTNLKFHSDWEDTVREQYEFLVGPS